MHQEINAVEARVSQQIGIVEKLLSSVGQAIVGQQAMLEKLLVGLLCNGHILIEGFPGLAKTRAVTSLAQALDADFQRVQFTPDLLPADLIGTLIYRPKSGQFDVRKGPIFANLVLADEINRAPAKLQSALLEAMQEGQATIGDVTYPLPQPFLVLATQNPLEHDGTYPLPEAQVDRFMLKVVIDYPSAAEEAKIIDLVAHTKQESALKPVASLSDILSARETVDSIYLDDKLKHYIVAFVRASRTAAAGSEVLKKLSLDQYVDVGASPRASIFLALAARAKAFMAGRGYVLPEDIKAAAPDVLRHRIIVSYEAEADSIGSDDIIQRLLDHMPVP